MRGFRAAFQQHSLVVVRSALTTDTKLWLLRAITFQRNGGPIQFNRWQTSTENPEILALHNQTLSFYQAIIGADFFKTYGFAMDYRQGARLLPHLDLVSNEVSSTVVYNCTGVYPIYVSKGFTPNHYNQRFTINAPPTDGHHTADLGDGDLVVFNGRNHFHWRDRLDRGSIRAVLLHYQRTVPNSKQYELLTSQSVPAANSISSALYGKRHG